MKCRFCDTRLHDVFLDLGSAPPSNAFLNTTKLSAPELHFPLQLYTCAHCHLVQVDEVQKHDALFSSDYVYFSSYSRTWLAHAERYVSQAVERLDLGSCDLVMEIASNDGYLLQYVKARGIPCIGIEPTTSTAATARDRGIETLEQFFGEHFARDFATTRRQASLVIANNVLAHVPNLNDFVAGLSAVLTPEGVITVEFPHLLQLVAQRQFDTVYHEHFSYFSFHTGQRVFASPGRTAHAWGLTAPVGLPCRCHASRNTVCRRTAGKGGCRRHVGHGLLPRFPTLGGRHQERLPCLPNRL
jgi:SAM-dependent methyltransferase